MTKGHLKLKNHYIKFHNFMQTGIRKNVNGIDSSLTLT